MKFSKNKQIVSLSLLVALGLSGCSTVNPYTGENEVNNTSLGAGIGAVGGALTGALIGGQKGAFIGGALGATAGGAIGYSVDKQNEELRSALVGTGVQVRKMGNSIQLTMASDVTFATNQTNIQPDFYPVLNSVSIVLKKYNKTNISITGYTDNTGGDAYNQQLSENRARSVGDFLIGRGISPNRIFTQGMGKRDPIASNATPNGRALNRRVVIMLRPIG